MKRAPATKTAEKHDRLPREVWVLIAANVVIAVGFGLVAPALPAFARSFDISVTAASVVISAFAVTRLLCAPVAGRLVTRLGERGVYLYGLLIVALGTGACAFATSYWHLVALRAAAGIGSAMFTVSAIALLVRLTPDGLRGRASGLWAASFLLGSVTGPALGGGLLEISVRAPFLVYAVALVAATALVWVLLRRSPSAVVLDVDAAPALPLRAALRISGYRAALVSSFANGWAVFGVRMSLLPLFVVEALRQDGVFAGTALSVFAASNVVMLLVSGRLSDRIGRRPLLLVGLVVSGLATIWTGWADGVPEFLVATVVAGLGTGLLTPPQQAAVADVVGRARGGQVLAVSQMAVDVGAIVGPLAAGVLADQFSYGVAFTVTGGLLLVGALGWGLARETLVRTP
ncbi:MFS transporter [Actinokineospora pegani]|uniref:MFS transporter n=1 Tax=Actinokineospora pegani TaxID=2654637 RepID=UPI0012E9BCA7|nr:MFS transporter [Actinokineospora pegani]